MSGQRKLICAIYAAIAVLALVTTYSQLLPFPPGGFSGFWAELKVNHVSRGIAIDLAFFVLAAALYILAEARRLGMRLAWLYLALGYLVDISVAFPIFLLMRERAMARLDQDEARLTAGDWVAFLVMTALIAWQVWFLMQ